MNGLWNWIGAKPSAAPVTMNVDPASPDILDEMEKLWRECAAEENKPDYMVVPASWFEKRAIKRQVMRRRGRTFVVRSLSAVLRPEIAAEFGLAPDQVPERLRL